MGLELPGAEVGTAWRSPALLIRGRMFAVIPTHRSAEPRSLAVRVPFADRDELLAADPATYYIKEHYVSYPCVLVRLDRVPEGSRLVLRFGPTWRVQLWWALSAVGGVLCGAWLLRPRLLTSPTAALRTRITRGWSSEDG